MDQVSLTEQEKEALLQVMERAKVMIRHVISSLYLYGEWCEGGHRTDYSSLSKRLRTSVFNTQEFDRQQNTQFGQITMEGQLYKWTNPLKGWQPRWFSVDHQQGVLHYYTVSEDCVKWYK